ncbi:MAG: hypothetical protein PHW47_07175 [Lachnospira sp.]|nr:hypothetical protein [Lachnospira sp.]
MDYTCRDTIIQNMKDCGCNQELIDQFMDCFERCDLKGERLILENYRSKLLDDLHRKYKEIDLLDYMVYQLDKCACSCESRHK